MSDEQKPVAAAPATPVAAPDTAPASAATTAAQPEVK